MAKTRAKRKPTPFSMGDWLGREETKGLFREWQSTEMTKVGLRSNPAAAVEERTFGSAREPTAHTDPEVGTPDWGAVQARQGVHEVTNVAVLSDGKRFKVMRLSEEEEFVIDELAKRVVEKLKEDPQWKAILAGAGDRANDEVIIDG